MTLVSALITGRRCGLGLVGRTISRLASGAARAPARMVATKESPALRYWAQFKWGRPRAVPTLPVGLPQALKGRWPSVWFERDGDPWIALLGGVRVAGADGWVIDRSSGLLSEISHRIGQDGFAHPAFRRLSWPPRTLLTGTSALVSCSHPDNYYHWTFDALPRLKMLRAAGIAFTRVLAPQTTRFQRESLERAVGRSVEIVSLDRTKQFECEELLVASEPCGSGNPSHWAVQWLREFAGWSESPRLQTRRLLVTRKTDVGRRIANEAELLLALKPLGFESFDPANHSWLEQLEAFSSAQFVVAPHGAALANLAYCQPGTGVIECFSPNYLNPCYCSLAAVAELRYDVVVGRCSERKRLRTWRQPMEVAPEAVLAAINRMASD